MVGKKYLTPLCNSGDLGVWDCDSTEKNLIFLGESSFVLLWVLQFFTASFMMMRELLCFSWSYAMNVQVIIGGGVARVLDSRDPNFKKGNLVRGMTRWEEYTLITAPETLFKIEHTDVPLSYNVGILSMWQYNRFDLQSVEFSCLYLS